MRINIIPVELRINRNDVGKYYIFASKFEIIFEDGVDKASLAESLFNDRIFDIYKSNVSIKHSVKGNNTNIIVCDGNDTVTWLLSLLKWAEKSNHVVETRIQLIKTKFENKELIDLSNSTNNINIQMKKMMIEAYCEAFCRLVNTYRFNNIFISKFKNCNSPIRIDTSFDRMYII